MNQAANGRSSITLVFRVFTIVLSTVLIQIPIVRAAPVTDHTIASAPTSEIHAQLKPRHETVLSSELATKVRDISVRDGERFTKKQVLVRLDCALEQARLTKMKATLAGAKKSAKIQKRLLELNSTGTLEAALAKIEVDKVKADIKAQSIVLSKCTVLAPFSGRVVEVKAKKHEFVRIGQDLLDILDDSSLDIDFIVPSRWLVWLKVGQDFSIAINETKRSYPGKVIRLGAKVDPVSQLVKVMGEISGQFPELMPGMSGRISIVPPQ
uniref:RND family efflux transporter, MFP subunit n=1 Tax=Candidatus Kentrum sp. TUN TaxID=2126343 RepID=A0A450ZPE8_9GAMM|nr:MAG: RND family efflux transporter, MFP subunit [Candidatus Kentron sp. TUN]VFK53155.1 MAG: RND family efflux transporter, MFP subunit [Candidatus Kentron sp. TUN]VFK55715.1 MAG: RND family efflux transporter, MFP subunit [Candidatus Kentron sp. TUN]